MLELIVLGQIPGTNIIITFNWVLVISAILFVALEAYLVFGRSKNSSKPKDLTEISL